MYPQFCSLLSLERLSILSTQSTLFETHVFLVSVIRSAPNHPPLRSRCLVKLSNRIRPAYLSEILNHTELDPSA